MLRQSKNNYAFKYNDNSYIVLNTLSLSIDVFPKTIWENILDNKFNTLDDKTITLLKNRGIIYSDELDSYEQTRTTSINDIFNKYQYNNLFFIIDFNSKIVNLFENIDNKQNKIWLVIKFSKKNLTTKFLKKIYQQVYKLIKNYKIRCEIILLTSNINLKDFSKPETLKYIKLNEILIVETFTNPNNILNHEDIIKNEEIIKNEYLLNYLFCRKTIIKILRNSNYPCFISNFMSNISINFTNYKDFFQNENQIPFPKKMNNNLQTISNFIDSEKINSIKNIEKCKDCIFSTFCFIFDKKNDNCKSINSNLINNNLKQIWDYLKNKDQQL